MKRAPARSAAQNAAPAVAEIAQPTAGSDAAADDVKKPTAAAARAAAAKNSAPRTSKPAARSTAARPTTAKGGATAKSTSARSSTSAAAKTAAAKTAAAKAAAEKAATTKSTARTAAAKRNTAKTTAAVAAAKVAAAKKAAAAKAAEEEAAVKAAAEEAAVEEAAVQDAASAAAAPETARPESQNESGAALAADPPVDAELSHEDALVEESVEGEPEAEEAVVEDPLVESAPVADAPPAEGAPPIEYVPDADAPVADAPVAEAPVEEVAVEDVPVPEALVAEAPSEGGVVEETLAETSVEETSTDHAGAAESEAAEGQEPLVAAPSVEASAPASAAETSQTDAGAEAIRIRGLVKTFGDHTAVNGIDLTVPAGLFYGIVGPNGAGKTTTLSIVAGLLRADEGSVVVCGIDQSAQPLAAKRVMGVLPDRLRTFDRLTGRQLLYYYGLLRGLAANVIEKRVADLARAFDLGDALSRVVSDYSAGMTKKIMLAGAMIHSPRVLVLDEPFEAVDPVSSAVILDILRAYVAHGGTVILSSHGMDLVERVCSRVAIIVGGDVLAEGTIDEVRAGQTLESRFVELAGSSGEVEGLEWLHTFSD